MPDRYPDLRALLDRARSQAAGAELLAGAAWTLALASLVLLAAALLARWLGPATVRPALLAALAAGGVAAIYAFVVRPRRGLRSERVVALRLAAAAPELRSDLLTAVELHREMGSPQHSEALAQAAIDRAAARTSRLDPRLAMDRRRVRKGAWALGAAASLHLIALATVPGMRSSYAALLAGVTNGKPAPSAVPIAGDIELTYRYPAYAGLPPKTVAGTGGEINALLGTEVQIVARADRDVDRALLVQNGAPAPMKVEGRKLTGRLTVGQAGEWRLRYLEADGDLAAEGPPAAIAVEPDLAPEVVLDAPLAEIEVNPDAQVPLAWHAADDFGLGEIALVFKPQGASKEVRKVIGGGRSARPELGEGSARAGDRTLKGDFSWALSELSLRPGDRVAYYLEALDRDTVSGPKRGVSRTLVLKVFSPAEHNRLALARAEALWERLILLLGDRIEPRSTAEMAGGGRATDERAFELAGEMRSAASDIYRDKAAPREIAAALLQIAQGVERAARRTASARRGAGRPLETALADEIAEEEKDILYLEDLIDRRKVEDLVELGHELRQSQRQLASAIERYKDAKDDAARRAVEQEIARLKDRIAELYQRMAELSRGIRDEHLNAEALAELAKNQDMLGGLDEVQRLLAEGKIDEALKALDRLGQQLDEMVSQLGEQRDRFGGEEYRELAKKMGEAMRELEEVAQEEERISRENEKVREATRKAMEEKLKKAGREFVEKQKERLQKARKRLDEVDKEVLARRNFEEEVDRAAQRLKDAAQALEMGDFDEARGQAAEGLKHMNMVVGQLMMESEWLRGQGGERSEGVQKSARVADSARPPVQQVLDDLDRLMPQPGEALSEQQRQDLERLGQEQRQNQGRVDRLQSKMKEIAGQAPLGDGPANALGEVSQDMGQAAGRLRGHDPRGASTEIQGALDRLAQLKESLKQRGKGGGGGVPLPFMPLWSEGEGDGSEMDRSKVEIPRPEQFEAPEEFRRELMEAMKQGAPEAYKERVKDYYQELVK